MFLLITASAVTATVLNRDVYAFLKKELSELPIAENEELKRCKHWHAKVFDDKRYDAWLKMSRYCLSTTDIKSIVGRAKIVLQQTIGELGEQQYQNAYIDLTIDDVNKDSPGRIMWMSYQFPDGLRIAEDVAPEYPVRNMLDKTEGKTDSEFLLTAIAALEKWTKELNR